MATDFTVFSRQFEKTSPLDNDVKVLHAYVTNTSAETNVLMPIPWENQRLVKAVACVTEVIDNVADWEIDLELNAAGGTEMMSISITKNSAVGTIFESTVTTQSACERLGGREGARDAINIESDGSNTPTGTVNLYMIFEPDTATN